MNHSDKNIDPSVAIIIPVYNGGATLKKCLESIRADCDRPNWELIVVDDASSDDSAAIAREAGARLIKMERNVGVSAARNAGARATGAGVVIFIDADIVVSPGALAVMVETLRERPEISVVGAYPLPGDLSPHWSAHFVGLRSAWGYHWQERESERRFSSIQSECGAMRKSVFNELDGFSERHGGVGMEEFHMAHELERRGYGHLLLRSASYRHHYKSLGRRCLALFDRTARWVPLLLRRKRFESRGAVGTGDAASSCLLTFIAVASLVAAIFQPWFLAAAGFAWFIQALIEIPFLRFARRLYGWPMVFYALPALQVMHVAIGLGFIRGLLRIPFVHRKTRLKNRTIQGQDD